MLTSLTLPNSDGDCIEFFFTEEDFHAVRINGYLSLYMGEESNEIVGYIINGVSRLSEKLKKDETECRDTILSDEDIEALLSGTIVSQPLLTNEEKECVCPSSDRSLSQEELNALFGFNTF